MGQVERVLPMKISDREAAVAFLTQRINYEQTSAIPYRSRSFKLDRMRTLLRHLGDPHLRLQVVHLAGTKGKGSTSHLIASILSASGYRVGLYTSPHLERIEERFLIDGSPCFEQDLVETVQRVAAAVEAMQHESDDSDLIQPTYLEITTAIALLLFELRCVDFAVCEVGLGGRLDSTNVCEPLVTAITSISIDHTRQLGDTVAAIAAEKAGIIKTSVPVVCGARDPAARKVIMEEAERQRAPCFLVDEDYAYQYHAGSLVEEYPTRFDFFEGEYALKEMKSRLIGDHQALNAAVAVATVRQLAQRGFTFPEEAIRRGVAETQCPARIEVVQRDPTTIIDSAHNVASIAALVTALEPLLETRSSTLVFATSQDKDLRGMLALLVPHFDTLICTRYLHNPRAVSPEEIAGVANDLVDTTQSVEVRVAEHPSAAWRQAQQGGSELIVVSGSFFIAGEVRRLAQGVGQSMSGQAMSAPSNVHPAR